MVPKLKDSLFNVDDAQTTFTSSIGVDIYTYQSVKITTITCHFSYLLQLYYLLQRPS